MIEFHWKAYSTHTPSLLQFFVSLHLHTELNLDAHLTAQMLQSAGATETSTSDDMSVLRVCEHRRVCKRAKEWTRNACVQQWEIIAACTHVWRKREREGVEMIRSVMLQTAVNVMQPRVNFSWHLWFLVATHTRWIFSSDRLSPRLSAIPIKTTCWWRKHGCWMKYDEFMHWNTTKRILSLKLIFSIQSWIHTSSINNLVQTKHSKEENLFLKFGANRHKHIDQPWHRPHVVNDVRSDQCIPITTSQQCFPSFMYFLLFLYNM